MNKNDKLKTKLLEKVKTNKIKLKNSDFSELVGNPFEKKSSVSRSPLASSGSLWI